MGKSRNIMNDKERMNYRVHLSNGEVWYCHSFGYLKNVASDFQEDWVDPELDYGMVEAILDQHIDWDIQPASLVVCLYTVSAVEFLTNPKTPRWHTAQREKLENFA